MTLKTNAIRQLFTNLNTAQIDYFVLRDFDRLIIDDAEVRDIDIYVQKSQKIKFLSILKTLHWFERQETPHDSLHYFYYFCADDKFLLLDVKYQLYFGMKKCYYKYNGDVECSEFKVQDYFIKCPAPSIYILFYLAHVIFEKKSLKTKHLNFLTENKTSISKLLNNENFLNELIIICEQKKKSVPQIKNIFSDVMTNHFSPISLGKNTRKRIQGSSYNILFFGNGEIIKNCMDQIANSLPIKIDNILFNKHPFLRVVNFIYILYFFLLIRRANHLSLIDTSQNIPFFLKNMKKRLFLKKSVNKINRVVIIKNKEFGITEISETLKKQKIILEIDEFELSDSAEDICSKLITKLKADDKFISSFLKPIILKSDNYENL